MAAGLGFKTFATGEVLTAADTNGYLMQGVLVFASATARDAAITSPQEGQFAYLKDTNVTTYYTGSAWANLDTTGMTNPMTTTGDTIYSSSGSTPARLGIGTTGQVLTVSGGVPTWATSSSGGMTLISTTTLTGSSVTISSIPGTYNSLQLRILNFLPATDNAECRLRINGDTNTRYNHTDLKDVNDLLFASYTYIPATKGNDNSLNYGLSIIDFPDYASTTRWKIGQTFGINVNAATTTNYNAQNNDFAYNQLAAITSLDLFTSTGNFTSGTALLYGVK